MTLIFKYAERDELRDIVECHIAAFPSFFLSTLGSRFLCCFYAFFIEDDLANLIVAVEDNRIIGFAAHCIEPKEFFNRLRRTHGPRLLFYALPALIKNPKIVVKKLFRGLFYRGDQVPEIQDAALLSSIGVSPDASGKNVGSQLLARVEMSVVKRGKTLIYLTTDLNNNEATLGFYKKNGYLKHAIFRQSDDRIMLRMLKQLV